MSDPKEEIKQKLDVAEVVGAYLQLKPAGMGSFKGICPFHAERTPSFHVSRERQIWHCFGCDKGGDIFAFVMEMEGMTFPEALRHLAGKAGVEIPEFRPQPKQQTDTKEALLAINALAQKWYAKVLADHPEAADARAYLQQRGITPELAAKFGIGYAPDRWDSLVQFLGSRGFAAKYVQESGLGMRKKSGEGLLDRFRHRLMIPLSDAVGNVVGFTARMMGPGKTVTPDGPKYMNSPETMVYHKGRMLYGLHLAKTAIRTERAVIVVEGNLDVVASHKAGVEHIVASSGTALTEEQLRILARYTKKIVFCLDADAAGSAAAKRAFEVANKLQDLSLEIRCLLIPEGAGKDPDEVVQKDPDLWRRIAAESQPIVEFMFDRALKQYEGKGSRIEDRKVLIAELMPEVARLTPAERHLYLLRIADATHVDPMVLEGMLPKTEGQRAGGAPARPVMAAKASSKIARAAEFLICVIMTEPSLLPELGQRLPDDVLVDEPWARLYTLAKRLYAEPQIEAATKQSFYSRLRDEILASAAPDDCKALDAALLTFEERVSTLSPTAMREELERYIHLLLSARLETQRRQLESAIREAELAGASDRLRILLEQYAQLLRK